MRVTHIAESLVGGPSTYIDMLVRHQLALGYDVSIIADPERMTDEIKRSGATIYTYRTSRSPWRVFDVALQVRKLIKQTAPDLIHAHGSFAGVYTRLLGHPGVPTVYCAHGWAFVRDVSRFYCWFTALVERYLARNTDLIVDVSRYERQIALTWGVRGNHMVIMNSVREAIPGAKLFERKSGAINLGFVGRLDYQKGFDLLLEAMRHDLNRDVHLWVAGDYYHDSSSTAEDHPNITFLGWLKSDSIDSFMRSIDALIMTSRWEGCPLVALEAMRNGKPVLISDRCGMPELIIEGFNGGVFSIDSVESIRRGIERYWPRELSAMGEHARTVFETAFHPSTMLASMDLAYQRVLKAPKRSPEKGVMDSSHPMHQHLSMRTVDPRSDSTGGPVV